VCPKCLTAPGRFATERKPRVQQPTNTPPPPLAPRPHRVARYLFLGVLESEACSTEGSRGSVRFGSGGIRSRSQTLHLSEIRLFDSLLTSIYATSLTISPHNSQATLLSLVTNNASHQSVSNSKFHPRSGSRGRERVRAKSGIYRTRLDDGGHRCGKEPSGIFPSLRSVAGGLATLPQRYDVRSTASASSTQYKVNTTNAQDMKLRGGGI